MQVLGLQTPVPRWPGKPTHMYDTLEDRCKKTICLTAALHITHASKYTSINCPQHTCSPNACMILWKMSTHSYTLFAMSKTKKTVCLYIYACMHIIYTYTYTNTYVQMHILYLPLLACSSFIYLNTSSLTKATVIQNKWYKLLYFAPRPRSPEGQDFPQVWCLSDLPVCEGPALRSCPQCAAGRGLLRTRKSRARDIWKWRCLDYFFYCSLLMFFLKEVF